MHAHHIDLLPAGNPLLRVHDAHEAVVRAKSIYEASLTGKKRKRSGGFYNDYVRQLELLAQAVARCFVGGSIR